MNALLYGLVVIIWGTTDCDFPAAGPRRGAVSIFWRFAVASLTMMVVLLALRRLRTLVLRIIFLPASGVLCFLL